VERLDQRCGISAAAPHWHRLCRYTSFAARLPLGNKGGRSTNDKLSWRWPTVRKTSRRQAKKGSDNKLKQAMCVVGRKRRGISRGAGKRWRTVISTVVENIAQSMWRVTAWRRLRRQGRAPPRRHARIRFARDVSWRMGVYRWRALATRQNRVEG